MIFTIAACQVNFSSMSETLVRQTEKKLRESATPVQGRDPSENINLLGDSVAVAIIHVTDGVPVSFTEDLTAYLNNRVSKMPFYSRVLTTTDLDAFFSQNRSLNQLKSIYLESLAQVSVSNKDISNPIGKALDADNLITFQVDSWPCADCQEPLKIRVKMRAIDFSTGLIIWTGINELKVPRSEEIRFDTLSALSEELLNQFQNRFERKWHRKRFQNLGLLSRN